MISSVSNEGEDDEPLDISYQSDGSELSDDVQDNEEIEINFNNNRVVYLVFLITKMHLS